MLSVGQARIARIERDPTAVSVEQFMAVLGALGVQVVLRANGSRSVADAPADASNAKSTRPALARRRPLAEPW